MLGRTALGRTLVTKEEYTEPIVVLTANLDVLRGMKGANPAWTRNAASLVVTAYERSGAPEKAEPYRELAQTGVAR